MTGTPIWQTDDAEKVFLEMENP